MFLKNPKFLVPGVLFISFLFYFVFSTGWYEPARIIIKGHAPDTNAFVDVQWDSGAGFNTYERETFKFLPIRGGLNREHQVVLTGGHTKNIASKNSRVVLNEIRIDGKGLPIPQSALESVRHVRGNGWFFESVDSKMTIQIPAKERMYFFLKANDRSGIVRISIDGFETSHDLYRGNWEVIQEKLNFWLLSDHGHFSVSFSIPRYAVDLLQFTVSEGVSLSSVYLETKTGRIIDLAPSANESTGPFLIAAPTKYLKHYFHKNRIVFQIVFALCMAWITHSLLLMISSYGGIVKFFFGKQLRLFWLFFFGSVAVYSLWFFALFPGVMSVDSLNIWRAAWLPDVMINNHPALNVVWYMFLLHFWDNIAVVPLSQILLLSILLASTFDFCYQRGISLLLLFPCFFLLLFSLPVGLYNVTLWKDIPFALLVVFWGLVPAYLYLLKSRKGLSCLSLQNTMFLLLLFLALILFRHNGIIYLFFIPVLFFFLQIVRVSRKFMLACCVVVILLTMMVVFPPKTMKSASYFHDLSRSYLQQFTKDSGVSRVKQSLKYYPRLLDIKKNHKQSDFWHYYLGDRYAFTFLRQSGWNDAHKYSIPEELPFPLLREAALKLYDMSLKYPWVYVSWNPFVFLYLFPLSILLCRWFPLSAIFSSVILVQVLALLIFVDTVNWRYYYFVLLGGYFLLPILLLDWHRLRQTTKGIAN